MTRPRLSWLTAPLAFTPVPVSVWAALLYGAVFLSGLFADHASNVPKDTKGLNFEQAFTDLQQITASPHPYTSHANDDVRAYLLARLAPIAAKHPHVHLSDDVTSNASFVATLGFGTYFESTNILLKIDGTDPSDTKPDGVLLSAHYDSVSSAPGATDDGMGVVTLLALAEYLAEPERRPRRTAVLFWNNGEEDGLNGAHAIWKHPWSNITSSFINLEGAASGGRPLVFRSTSLGTARSFSGGVSHPHLEVLVSDAWASGVIRSRTDYEVYARGLRGHVDGMSGVDFAFYHNRAFYHTPMDSIAGMGYGEGRKSLWAMMDGTRGAALSLLNDDESGNDQAPGIFFDIIGRAAVVFSVQALFIANVILLVVGPIVTLLLLGWVLSASGALARYRSRSHSELQGWAKAKKISVRLLGWGQFWIAVIVAAALQVALVAGYLNVNPYIIHSRPYLVLTTFLAFAYLGLVLPLKLTQTLLPALPRAQKLAITLEHYFLTWIALVCATVATQRWHVGALYWVSVWNASAWVVAALSLAEALKQSRAAPQIVLELAEEDEQEGGEQRLVRGVLYEAPAAGTADEHEDGEVETEPTEITPLMRQLRVSSHDGANGNPDKAANDQEYGWWIVQMLVGIPPLAALLFKIELLVLLGLNNTVCDGSNPITIYVNLAFFSFLMFVPLAPFAQRMHRGFTLAVVVVFVATLVVGWVAFPFTRERPFRVYFQQQVELSGPTRVTTEITGLPGYIDRLVAPEFPSSRGQEIACRTEGVAFPNLMACTWRGLNPSPGALGSIDVENNSALVQPAAALAAADWVEVKSTRLTDTRAIIALKGTNARACRVYFDAPINFYRVHGADAELLHGYEMPAAGVRELRLWSRTWDREFVVEVAWGAEGPAPTGRAACEWAEYASGAAGGRGSTARIPAFEEAKQFLPLWALPSKAADGLVEASVKFAV